MGSMGTLKQKPITLYYEDCEMKSYLIGMGFAPLLTFAHFMFPQVGFMFFIAIMIGVYASFMFNHKEPEYEWPELSFTQDDKIITLTMTKKDGETKRNYLSLNRLSLPVREKEVVKVQSSIWHVLGIMPTNDSSVVEKAFRKMSMVYHPDVGGDSKAFNTLVNAKEKALQKCIR